MRVLFAAVVCFVWSITTQAADLSVGLKDVTTIDNGRGESRLLFRLDTVALPPGTVIGSATLVLPFGGATTGEELEVDVLPVTTAWSPASVDWTDAWTRPGGDVDHDFMARGKVRLTRGESARIDVTGAVHQVLKEGVFADGFVVTVPWHAGEGIPSSRVAGIDVANGHLTITYRKVGPRAPGR